MDTINLKWSPQNSFLTPNAPEEKPKIDCRWFTRNSWFAPINREKIFLNHMNTHLLVAKKDDVVVFNVNESISRLIDYFTDNIRNIASKWVNFVFILSPMIIVNNLDKNCIVDLDWEPNIHFVMSNIRVAFAWVYVIKDTESWRELHWSSTGHSNDGNIETLISCSHPVDPLYVSDFYEGLLSASEIIDQKLGNEVFTAEKDDWIKFIETIRSDKVDTNFLETWEFNQLLLRYEKIIKCKITSLKPRKEQALQILSSRIKNTEQIWK